MMKTQQQAKQKGAGYVSSSAGLFNSAKTPVKMRVGDGTPGPGRPKGSENRVHRTIREAVEMAARDCHPEGLAGWLVDRAKGDVQDRQIFAGMVGKVIPLQVQAKVDGGIKLELSWLSSRSIGTTQAQIAEQSPQVIDLERDSSGEYRIRHQDTQPDGGGDAPNEQAPEGAGDDDGAGR